MPTTPLNFQRSSSFHDLHRYTSEPYEYQGDPVLDMTVEDLPRLFSSWKWEDRIRAGLLMRRLEPVLPPAFPCIYETADSPNHSRHKHPRPRAWVVSADVDLLHDVIDVYQELWDAYTSQWGEGSRRTFAVGVLDNLPTYGVYTPEATVSDVIVSTLFTHTDMRGRLDYAPRAKAIWGEFQQSLQHADAR